MEDPEQGDFEQLADIIDERSDISILEMQVLGQCLTDMDARWDHLQWRTMGGLMSYMVCAGKDKSFEDELCKDLVDFLESWMKVFLSVMKPGGNSLDEKKADAKKLESVYHNSIKEISGRLSAENKSISSMGVFLSLNVILQIPRLWIAYCDELASAVGMIGHAMPLDQASYFKDLLVRTQVRKLDDLVQWVDECSFTYNSKPFQEAEVWASQAGRVYEYLISVKGCEEFSAMDAVVTKFGAPWLCPEEFS
jgi:hypothetical protein